MEIKLYNEYFFRNRFFHRSSQETGEKQHSHMSETSEEEASQHIWALWRDAAHAPAISILLNSTDFQTIRRAITTLQTKTQNWFLLKKR